MNYAFPKVTSMIVMFFFLTGPRAPLCVCVKEECAIQRVLVYPWLRLLNVYSREMLTGINSPGFIYVQYLRGF